MNRKTIIILALLLLFIVDFICYKVYGVAVVNGNILTIDFNAMASLQNKSL